MALPGQLSPFSPAGSPAKLVPVVPTGRGAVQRRCSKALFKDRCCSSRVLWCLQASLRSAVAVVPQDTVLFNDTILNNIGYGRPEAPEEEIIKAAEMARLSDAIARMPNGEDCPGCSVCRKPQWFSGREYRLLPRRGFCPKEAVCQQSIWVCRSLTSSSNGRFQALASVLHSCLAGELRLRSTGRLLQSHSD